MVLDGLGNLNRLCLLLKMISVHITYDMHRTLYKCRRGQPTYDYSSSICRPLRFQKTERKYIHKGLKSNDVSPAPKHHVMKTRGHRNIKTRILTSKTNEC
jgi:hypothetical protein